jgi:hypothetical protein
MKRKENCLFKIIFCIFHIFFYETLCFHNCVELFEIKNIKKKIEDLNNNIIITKIMKKY